MTIIVNPTLILILCGTLILVLVPIIIPYTEKALWILHWSMCGMAVNSMKKKTYLKYTIFSLRVGKLFHFPTTPCSPEISQLQMPTALIIDFDQCSPHSPHRIWMNLHWVLVRHGIWWVVVYLSGDLDRKGYLFLWPTTGWLASWFTICALGNCLIFFIDFSWKRCQ